ncbi:HlyD family type I secretion periplasmic adaptor subunit [Sphingosinicella sp. BN140058]|uniref:HlyD family type I secretion periplasmic adaptor subunit n=1 Tax=Sphingosinicella sp. BN140058 TaxID=1892855 RepID=UPI0010126D22|nr:HlyD family type I secretion periplasmic adaptor subunit [Sphingosinicella sp. BN140058]QAY76356.1 HlyD family type I secretion periplasmic adaptor subunit [Sphingosinicella sp. BN140058]
MLLHRVRDRIIIAAGGATLFENVKGSEAQAALGGRLPGSGVAIGGLAPWSTRAATERQTWMLRILVLLTIAFVAWASLFSIDKVTRGGGRVLPSVQNQVVQHLEGGIAQEILVKEGQRVHKGQVLLRIENAYTGAELENSHTDVIAKKITLARMDAEVAGAGDFVVPEELAAQAPEIAASEVSLFHSRRAQRGQQTGIIDEQARARRAEIGSLQARLANLRNEEKLMMVQLDKLERAFAEDAISERDVLEKRSALLALRTRIADVQNEIPQSSAALGESAARRNEVWTREMEETKERAAQLRLELSKADEQYGAAQDKATREEVRAPMDGIVNKLYIQTVGGVIKAGEPIAEIVPVDDVVMVEARIAPKDRGEVWPGLPARIKISAYDSSIYGGLEGKVLDVSPDIVQDQKGEVFYRVRLSADTTRWNKPVTPGMTAEVNIRSGKQTILDYILGPLIRIRDTALQEH